MSDPLRVEVVGAAAVLTIDRPASRNAIDRDLAQRLGDAIGMAAADPSVRGIILAATGDATFVSGGDLRELEKLVAHGGGGDQVLAMFEHMRVIETCEVPVIAAVQGDTYGGGCELLLLCDNVILESHAALAFRHAKMGLSPAWGGLTRLVERTGPLEAARLLFTAEKIGADEALRVGLVNEVVERGEALNRAKVRVARIAENPRATVAGLKAALREVREARRTGTAEAEREAFSKRWGGEDHRAALAAFFEAKTEPR